MKIITMIQLTLAITMGGVAILLAVLFWFMPRLTRLDLYFAVTVPAGFMDEPQGKSILRHYRIELILVSALGFTAFVAGIVWLGVGFVPGATVTSFSFLPDLSYSTGQDNARCPTQSRPP